MSEKNLDIIPPSNIKIPSPGNYEFEEENLKETISNEKLLKFEKLKLWLNFFKWAVGSVALTLIVFILNWGLRERSQGIEEITQYEKHVELVTTVENVQKRRLLAQFFMNVTASDKLKKGWLDYYQAVDKEYLAYLKSLEEEKTDAKKAGDTEKVKQIERKQEQLKDEGRQSPIATISPEIKGNVVYFHITDENLRNYSADFVNKLKAFNYNVVDKVEYVDVGLKGNLIKYFKVSDLTLANNVQKSLDQAGLDCEVIDNTHLSGRVKDGTIEVWISEKTIRDSTE